ncbi:MAG: SipW-dependent-type signal peptide-containing protein [Pseudolysinimonas sp.]
MAAGRPYALTRVRAVLAGALVLGVGTTMTLASWTDSEFGQGSFTTTKFDTQSSVDGGTNYADNTPSAATLAFDPSGMSPNTQRYALFLIRTKAGSVAGTLSLGAATISPAGADDGTNLAAALRYRVVSTTGTCNAAAFTGSPVWVLQTSSPLATAGASTVAVAAATASPGAASGLCFEISLPAGAPNTLQGKTGSATWQVTATSN